MKMKMIIELFHQKLIEVMLVNGIKKPKPLYNVCPKTMLLSILQQTLSIHQVQLLTSLEQTKNYRHTHRHRKTKKKKLVGENVVLNSLHGPTKQFTTYHPQYTTDCNQAHGYCRVVSREPRRETIPKYFVQVDIRLPAVACYQD